MEFAIIMPLVFALFLGIFTGGMSLSRKNSMTNAVREGARLGATLPEDSAWASSVQARVVGLAAGDLEVSDVCVQLVQKTSATAESIRRSVMPSGCSSVTPPASTGVPVGHCVVKVWANRTSELQAIFFSRTLPLDASSIGRYERKGTPETCTS